MAQRMTKGRSFLKLQNPVSLSLNSPTNINIYTTCHRCFSKTIVQAKLLDIRSRVKEQELDGTDHLEKANYLQRANLNPSKLFLQKHPILLNERSLIDIKNLLYLLRKRCGFDEDCFLKIYEKYPSILEVHPNDIMQCLHRFKTLGFNQYQAFLRLEPSILLPTHPSNSVLLDRLKLYKEILSEIGVENGTELLEKHCVHIIQREPKYVLGTLKYYEQLGLDLKRLIVSHPQCMIYSLSHIKKVIRFIHDNMTDIQGIDIKIIQSIPQILGINLVKMKKVIAWLHAVDMFQISEILAQCPALLTCNDVDRLDETLKYVMNTHGISKSEIRNNLWLILLRKESIQKRIDVMNAYDIAIVDHIELLQNDHNHLHRLFKKQLKEA